MSGTAKSGASYSTILNEMYEWSQIRLARAFSFAELDVLDTTTKDTVTSTASYTYATLLGATAQVKEILSIVIEDGLSSRKLVRMLPRDFYRRIPDPSSQSTRKPEYYYVIGTTVYMYPIPDAVYDIHTIYSKMPTRATVDTYLSEFNFKDDLLILGTVLEFWNFYQEYAEAEAIKKIWKDKLKEAVDSVIHPTDWEPEGRAFNSSTLVPGEFWNNPFIMRNM